MAIRKPTVYRERDFVFQDFLYCEEGDTQLRYVVGKWDGSPYELVQQTFDYSSPDLKGGDIVSRVDYTLSGKLLIIDEWFVNWRDEWPLRLTAQFLTNCRYSLGQGYAFRVRKEPYSFWVSENFFPLTNDSDDLLLGK